MSRPSANAPCPCTSGLKYKKCCGRVHQGQTAPTPEALMRSRYAAYALGLVEHILRTTHPDGPHHRADATAWRAEVRAFCEGVSFEGLEVVHASEDGDRGVVEFRAHLVGGAGRVVMAERSTFLRRDGRWLYHSGVRVAPAGE